MRMLWVFVGINLCMCAYLCVFVCILLRILWVFGVLRACLTPNAHHCRRTSLRCNPAMLLAAIRSCGNPKKTGACAEDAVEPLTARSKRRNAPVSVEEAAEVYGQPPVVADCGPRVGEQRSTPKS